MLKDVTLGQYFPGETAIHKMDPRTKLVLVIVYIVALFLAKGAAGYALVAGCLLAVVWISKIHLKVILKGLKPLMLIIILTAVLNLFYGQGEPIVKFWIFKITKEGIEKRGFHGAPHHAFGGGDVHAHLHHEPDRADRRSGELAESSAKKSARRSMSLQ